MDRHGRLVEGVQPTPVALTQAWGGRSFSHDPQEISVACLAMSSPVTEESPSPPRTNDLGRTGARTESGCGGRPPPTVRRSRIRPDASCLLCGGMDGGILPRRWISRGRRDTSGERMLPFMRLGAGFRPGRRPDRAVPPPHAGPSPCGRALRRVRRGGDRRWGRAAASPLTGVVRGW